MKHDNKNMDKDRKIHSFADINVSKNRPYGFIDIYDEKFQIAKIL